MIKIQNLEKYYTDEDGNKTTIYRDMSLEIKKWEFIAILGTSGSGKTTLLNLLSGLDDFQWGEIEIAWEKLATLSSDQKTAFRAKNISFIFQQFNLIDNLTAEENLDLIVDLNKLKRRYETDELLWKVGLEHKKKAYPFHMSGWEQQRVAVARAFVGDTPLLLADEPTGNLDQKNSEIVMQLIDELHKDAGNTIIMITHDLEIAARADKSYVLQDNILVEHKHV